MHQSRGSLLTPLTMLMHGTCNLISKLRLLCPWQLLLDSSLGILFFFSFINMFTIYVFSLQNSMWKDGFGLLTSLPTELTEWQCPSLGRLVIDSLGQLSSCLVLARNSSEFLVYFSFFLLLSMGQEAQTALHSAQNQSWKSALGLGLRPKC